MIKLENVTFKYDKIILDNINLNIDKNKVTFIIGANGSGKSTLANIISGLSFPNAGNVQIDDIQLTKKTNNKVIRKKIGMVFQNPSNQIIFSKVSEDIQFTLENMKIPKKEIQDTIKKSLKKVNMLPFIDENPYKLSGGQKQRVAIASQLSLNPDYIIFDEATSMLDVNGKKDIYSLLKALKENIGIIFITNNISELQYADDVVIIDNKKVYKYSIADIIKDNQILSKHNFDVPFLFKIAKKLNINDIHKINEESILKRIKKL